MTAYKHKLQGVMEEFYAYLNIDGMTNEQAITKIKQDHGEHWEDYIRDEIKREDEAYD